jgi:hypothetical protein
MSGVFANYSDIAVAANDFALSTNSLDRRSNFHANLLPFRNTPAKETLGFGPVSDAATIQVIRREFHGNLVAREDADEMHAHFPGNVGENSVTLRQLNTKHGIGKGFDHCAFNFNRIFFSHVLTLLLAIRLRNVRRTT